MKKLLLFFIIVLVLVTPVSADRIINTEQVESVQYTFILEELCVIKDFTVNNIFPELVLPENVLRSERACPRSAYLSEIAVQMLLIIDIDGIDVDRGVAVGVFLPGDDISKSFGSLDRGDVQSIYPKLEFVAPLEAVSFDYYVIDGGYIDSDYPVYCTFNIEYYWEFSWIVSLKSESITPTTGGLNPQTIAILGVGGVFVVFLVAGFVEWDNRRNRRVKEKNIKEIKME